MDGLLRRLVSNFLQGLLFITPIAVTVFAVVWFVNLVDDFFDPLIHDLCRSISLVLGSFWHLSCWL